MKRFIEGEDRKQVTLLPECLDDFIAEENPVRIIDAFVEELELGSLGFDGTTPSTTGRPSHYPAVLLKIYICGYLNRVQSSRRLERECQRNVALMWLTGRLASNFKTIADFRRDSGIGIRNVCRRFVVLRRDLKLFSQALVAIDGSKFKAVNTRDRNFTAGKVVSNSRGSVQIRGDSLGLLQNRHDLLHRVPFRLHDKPLTAKGRFAKKSSHRGWSGFSQADQPPRRRFFGIYNIHNKLAGNCPGISKTIEQIPLRRSRDSRKLRR